MVLKTSSIGCILCFELEGAEDGFKMIESLYLLIIN